MFAMTGEGYIKAKQYLKDIGKLEEFENNKTSTDGYSLVYYANYWKEENEKGIL